MSDLLELVACLGLLLIGVTGTFFLLGLFMVLLGMVSA